MSIQNLCAALAAVQSSAVWGSRLPSSELHPLEQPLLLIPETVFFAASDESFPPNDARIFWSALPERRERFQSRPFFSSHPIFKRAREFDFGGATEADYAEVGWMYGFIGASSRHPRFRAAMGAFLVVDSDLFTTGRVAEFLGAALGDRLTVSPLFAEDRLKIPSGSPAASTDIPCLK